ncbi:MAG: tRNA lysidine(34) synthetase TilS [Candidatus Eremiobacteraeota bacterium]|nr:tRNA lysidine(34) synthetase TilS [Candidatus Eremiobacteraeota bacterium]
MRGAKPGRALEEALERSDVLARGERILIACSGGSDSVALAALLRAVAVPLELSLLLAHINHGTRDSAWQDEAVALRVAAALGIPLKVRALHAERRSEATLREARYKALSEIAQEVGAALVATAHHAEDQTETVLLALFRGSGLDGIAGMSARRALAPGVDLARPLLRFEPEDLRAYVQTAALPYAVDPSNSEPEFRRNAVREALSVLRPLFPGLDAAVARTAEVAAHEVAASPVASLRRRVSEALKAEEALADVDFEHVEAVVRTLARGGTGRFIMNDRIELAIENGRLKVQQR